MNIRNKIGAWLRDKLGVTETRLEFEKQLQYLNSYLQLVTPDKITFSPVLHSYLRERASKEFGIADFDSSVHKNDLMFHHQLRRFPDSSAEAVYKYFRVGMVAAKKLSALLPEDFEVGKLLDFGSGYARCSRFYPAFFPAAEIQVSEIKEQALRYQQETFGFKTLLHGSDANSLNASNYDLIIAISVFTHLPEALCREWLQKLFYHLRPGGKLIFTYVNIDLAPTAATGDYHFTDHSEDAGVSWVGDRITDTSVYGSTFYSDDRLRKLIIDETGKEPELLKAFLGKHDAAVLNKPI